jgi:hypothetical protein
MAPNQAPATFFSEFLKLSERQAILMVLEWRQRLLDEGKASATINLRITALKSLVAYVAKNGAYSFSLSEIRSLKSQPYKDTRGVPVDDYRSLPLLIDRLTWALETMRFCGCYGIWRCGVKRLCLLMSGTICQGN